MLKKLLILLLLFIGIQSCKEHRHRIEAIGIESSLHLIVGVLTNDYNNKYLSIKDYTNNIDGIRYDSLGIVISSKLINTGVASANFELINSANAWTVPEVHDQVSEIIITSNKDYNDDYISGTNLLSILSARYTNGSYTTGDKPVLEVFKELDYSKYLLYFNISPASNEQHIFTITIKTTDGKILTTTTKEVFIRKN